MPGAAEVLDLNGLAEWFKRNGLNIAHASFLKPLRLCRLAVIAATKDNFAGQHAPDGTPWLALKRPRDRARDRRAAARGGQQQILRDTGLLMASVSATGAAGHVEELDENRLLYGTALVYAGPHQHGAVIQKPEQQRTPPQKPWSFLVDGQRVFTYRIRAHAVPIPARPFLGLNDHVIGQVLRIFGDFVSSLVH